MSQNQFASGHLAIGICDICSRRCKYTEMRTEPLSAYGAPSNASSGLRACPDCYDGPNPRSFLPLVVAAVGSDAQQLRYPRPDVFPKTYNVKYVLPTSLYSNSSSPLTLSRGFSGNVRSLGSFGGYTATVIPPTGVTVASVQLPSPSVALLIGLHVDPSMAVGEYVMTMVDGNNVSTSGQLLIV